MTPLLKTLAKKLTGEELIELAVLVLSANKDFREDIQDMEDGLCLMINMDPSVRNVVNPFRLE